MGRTLHLSNPPAHGPDVLALQTALQTDGFYKGALDSRYGQSTAHACELAKAALGYPKSRIHAHHETADPLLLAFLQGHKRLPVAFRLRRPGRVKAATKLQASRAATVAYWNSFLLPKADEIHYSERRPMEDMNALETLPVSEDCSTTATKGCKAGGFRDPNGLFYSAEGYTGTMLAHCRRIAQHQVQPADLVVFVNPREPAGHHVCQVLEIQGDDMWVGSHGQETDPRRLLLSQEAAGQAGMGATEVHFLAVAA